MSAKNSKRFLKNGRGGSPRNYWERNVSKSLLQSAERAAAMRATGRRQGEAWPTMNNMRNVEPSTPFRLAERLRMDEEG